MPTFQRFEDIEAWKKARELTRAVYAVTKVEPFCRDYGLVKQVRNASTSIMSNIAEGFERSGRNEFGQFLAIAKGSAGEVRSHLCVALDQGYLDDETFERLSALASKTGRMLAGLMSYLRGTEHKGTKYKRPTSSKSEAGTSKPNSGGGVPVSKLETRNLKLETSSLTKIAISVVEKGGRFLIGRRPDGVPLAGMWEFPGGKVEPGETPPATAARECLEETGLAVEVRELLTEVDYLYDHGAVRLYFFLCAPQGLAAPLQPPFRWVAGDRLPQYDFPPANAEVLEILASRSTGSASGR